MKKPFIFLIVGETCSGKDSIVKEACKYINRFDAYNIHPARAVVSYTDRNIRDDETDGVSHYFITPEEFDKIYNSEKIAAYTKIAKKDGSGYRYMAKTSEVKNSLFYIINPKGIVDFKERSGDDFEYRIIYINTPVYLRDERAKQRSDYATKYKDRCEAEYEEFKNFVVNKEMDFTVYNDEDLGSAVNSLLYIVEKEFSDYYNLQNLTKYNIICDNGNFLLARAELMQREYEHIYQFFN